MVLTKTDFCDVSHIETPVQCLLTKIRNNVVTQPGPQLELPS